MCVREKAGTKQSEVEVQRFDGSGRPHLEADVHDTSFVIPLGEALAINDPQVTRSVMMGIVGENPEEYMDSLRLAGQDRDVEVVHYAVTAMAEISKEYDLKLQQFERAYAHDQNNHELISDYRRCLEEYLGNKIGQGSFLTMQRVQYGKLLEKELVFAPGYELYVKKAKNHMVLGEYEQADRVLDAMEKLYPGREETWMLQIESCARQGDGDGVRALLKKAEASMKLSAAGREIADFWNGGKRIGS